jgi:hypothetical protein
MNASTEVDEAKRLRYNANADLWLLRGLIWCAFCELPMTTVLDAGCIRHYGCTDTQCRRPLVTAEETEQLVWHRFRLLNEAFAAAVKRHQRQAVLREVLKRVSVHSGPSDLYFEWRD